MISPCDCKHEHTLFIQSSDGGPPMIREHVSLCRDCGQFRVSAQREGVTIVTTFTLPTWELVRAAGQYARLLETEETPLDHERLAEDFVFRWIGAGSRKKVLLDLSRLSLPDAILTVLQMWERLDDLGQGSLQHALEFRADRRKKKRLAE
jgi:hypothetical protein